MRLEYKLQSREIFYSLPDLVHIPIHARDTFSPFCCLKQKEKHRRLVQENVSESFFNFYKLVI